MTKKYLASAIACILSISATSYAKEAVVEEEEPAPAKSYTVNVQFAPLPILLGMVNLDIGMRITDRLMLGPTGHYWNVTAGDLSAKAYGIGLRGDYALAGPWSEDGPYLAPFLEYSTFDLRFEGDQIKTSLWSGGAVVGYRFLGYSGFNFTAGIGGGLASIGDDTRYVLNGEAETLPFQGTGFFLAFELAMGWAF